LDIVIVGDYGHTGGVAVHTLGLATALAARGHRIDLVHVGPAAPARPAAPGIRFTSVHSDKPLRQMPIGTLRRLLRDHPGDLCILPKGDLEVGGMRLDLLARLLYRRYVTIEHLTAGPMPPMVRGRHLHGLLPGMGLWWFTALIARYLRWVCPHHVFCVSEAVRARLHTGLRFPAAKLTVVRNGIDTAAFTRSAQHRQAQRREWRVPDDALVLGAVGRLARIKRFDVVLRVLARLRVEHQRPLRLVLAGAGPEEESLRSAAEQLGISDLVVFAGPTGTPWKTFSGFDLFVMPSEREGLPLALLEAMSCECAAVATAVGGIPEVIDDEVGWLVPTRDDEAFYAAVNEAVSEPECLLTRARAARRRVVRMFDAAQQFGRLCAEIERRAGAPAPVLVRGERHA
jgi:glycosyltransferase involved in cell wall biosynthesis